MKVRSNRVLAILIALTLRYRLQLSTYRIMEIKATLSLSRRNQRLICSLLRSKVQSLISFLSSRLQATL